MQADAIRSFGGTPVNRGIDWLDRMRINDLEGGEFDIAQALADGDVSGFSNVTANMVLWPAISVFSFNQKRFDSLTAQQQAWVREAASRAVLASLSAQYDESAAAQALCADGVRLVNASRDQIAELRHLVEPVIEELGADNGEDSLFTDLRALAAQYPEPDVLDVPAGCRQPRVDKADSEVAPTYQP